MTAAIVLAATPRQMGILAGTGGISVLVFSLFAGIVADRVRRRPLMIAADLGRAAVLSVIPILALTYRLTMNALLVVAACAGVLTVLFDVAYQSYLPTLVKPEELLESNRRLSISSATAEVLGPALTGILVQLITGPLAILLDAISFVVSAFSVMAIRQPEPPPHPVPHTPPLEEILAGLRSVLAQPLLRPLFFRSIMASLSLGPLFAFYTLYPLRVLHLNTVQLGFAISFGGAGALVGGFFAARVSRFLGPRRCFLVTATLFSFAIFLIPLASLVPTYGLLCLCAQQFFGDSAATVFFVNETTLRQTVTPAHLLGRVNAAMQIATRGMLPLGAIAAGFLAERIGLTGTLWISASGLLISTVFLLALPSSSPDLFENATSPSPL